MDQFRVGSVPEHFMLPWHLAIENAAFRAQNLAVDWQDYPGGTGAMMTDLRSGQLDIAIALTEGVVASIIQHAAGKIAQIYVESPLTWGVHVAANSSYQSVAELEGKTFAVSRMGSGSHLMAFVMAKQYGWSTDQIKLQIVGGMDGARQALPQGEADAFMWEKFMTQPVVERGEFRRIGEFDTPWPCFVVIVRNEILEKHLNKVRTVLKIVQQYAQDFMQRIDAATMVAQRYGLSEADAQAWFAGTVWKTDFSVSSETLTQVMTALLDCQVIEERVEPESLCSELVQLI
ncbi:MAG: substrate-binding domain-containing protein [Cyclobacteriaceae bacterium]